MKTDKRTSNDVFQKPINGTRECKWCHKKFENITGSALANHVRWCEKNPNRGKGLKEKLQASKEKDMLKKYGPYKDFEVECSNPNCPNTVIVHEREKKFPEKEHYFCSNHCAHSYSARCVDSENIKLGRKHFDDSHPGYWSCISRKTKYTRKIGKAFAQANELETRLCAFCTKVEFICPKSSTQQCCSVSCGAKLRQLRIFQEKLDAATSDYERLKLELSRYRLQCAFTFSLNDYPDEFDFKLIEQYGWYKAKNRGNNLNGVSRDHMYSVKEGFLNKVDPKILAHPANCRLIRHNDNVSKGSSSTITLEQLLERIRLWNKKYNLLDDC